MYFLKQKIFVNLFNLLPSQFSLIFFCLNFQFYRLLRANCKTYPPRSLSVFLSLSLSRVSLLDRCSRRFLLYRRLFQRHPPVAVLPAWERPRALGSTLSFLISVSLPVPRCRCPGCTDLQCPSVCFRVSSDREPLVNKPNTERRQRPNANSSRSWIVMAAHLVVVVVACSVNKPAAVFGCWFQNVCRLFSKLQPPETR